MMLRVSASQWNSAAVFVCSEQVQVTWQRRIPQIARRTLESVKHTNKSALLKVFAYHEDIQVWRGWHMDDDGHKVYHEIDEMNMMFN